MGIGSHGREVRKGEGEKAKKIEKRRISQTIITNTQNRLLKNINKEI